MTARAHKRQLAARQLAAIRHPRRCWYVLSRRGVPQPVHDLLRWAQWFEHAERRVARDEVGSAVVSTVFLGLDHGWRGGLPILFETMVFADGDRGGDCWRYATRSQALAGHARVVAQLRAGEGGDGA